MNSAIDPVHFWDQYRETACSKDASSDSSINHSSLGSTAVSAISSNKLGGDTSSFLVVPTKRNFVPTAHGLTPTQLALKTIALAQIKAKKTSLLFSALTKNKVTPPNFAKKPKASPSAPSSAQPTISSDTDLDFKTSVLPYLARECLGTEKETLRTLIEKLDGLLPNDKQWHELNQLRIHAGAPERSEKGIDRLLEYYGLLLFLEKQIPFETDAFKGKFTWYDAFHPNKKVTGSCIQYEKASVLFNLAATYAQLGAQQKMWTNDGIKLAALYFQKAAGVISYIRDALSQRIRVEIDKSSDLSEATLNALFELMIAQAHECFVEKANMDFASSQLTSQLCAQTGEHYELAYCSSTHHVSQFARLLYPRFSKTWIQYMHAKHFLYTAVAHFHCPPTSDTPHLGERIARLIIAKTISEKAIKEASELRGTISMLCQFYHTQILNALHLAETENTMKFQYPIMDPRMLSPLKRLGQSVVVPLPYDPPVILQKGLFCHVLFDEALRLPWLQTHLKRVRLATTMRETFPPCRERTESQLQLLRQWLDQDAIFFSSESFSETFQHTEFLAHQSMALWTQLNKDENTFSKNAIVESSQDVLQTCEEVLHKCQYVLEHVDTTKISKSPTLLARIDPLSTELYTLTKSLEQLQTESAKCRSGPEDLENVLETWTDEKLKALVVHADPSLHLVPEDVESLEETLKDILNEIRSLSLLEKKLHTSLQDPLSRLAQRVEDTEEQYTTFLDLQKTTQQKFKQMHASFMGLKQHIQHAKENVLLLEQVYMQLREWDQRREQAQEHLKSALALSEKLHAFADQCELFPVQLPAQQKEEELKTSMSLLSASTSIPSPIAPLTLPFDPEERQRKTHHLGELKKIVQMQKLKYRLKKAALHTDSTYLTTSPPTLALQKETEKMIHEHYSDVGLPSTFAQTETGEVEANMSMEEVQQQKLHITDQWAASQVDLAKRRKKVWKKSQRATGSRQATSTTTEGAHTRPLMDPALADKIKSDSGFTTMFHGVEGDNITDTLSQLKLKNDEVLAHFSPTPSLHSSRSRKNRQEKENAVAS